MANPTSLSPKKKLLVTLAIFILPVIAVIVAIAVLIKPPKSKTSATAPITGFNKTLPEPNLPKQQKNKLEIYMEAQADSIKLQQERSKDPYASDTLPMAPHNAAPARTAPTPARSARSSYFSPPATGYEDPNEKKVNDQLKKLYAALAPSPQPEASEKMAEALPSTSDPDPGSDRTAQLQQMMAQLQKKDTETDPKLQQISNLLDKVLAIKNSGRYLPGNPAPVESHKVLPVETQPVRIDSPEAPLDNETGFYGLSDASESEPLPSTSIQAVIHGTQTIQTGSIVKLRLLQPIFIGETRIPANSFIYGPATIAGERVQIQLSSAIYNDHIYPVSLKVYDASDGLEGLYVPGAITRDVIKENMSAGVSSLGLTTLDQSLGAQALSAGIETTKNLLSHKIRIVKVTLQEGHVAILKPTENHL